MFDRVRCSALREVTEEDAARNFLALLDLVEGGETIAVTPDGERVVLMKPWAQLDASLSDGRRTLPR
jgi:antitoxin (DNA-binding transcriptional repressor) of toxin-antitoxin stability system